MNRVLLQLGGNRGNVVHNFQEAIGHLEAKAGMVVLRSRIYETEPWGFADKRWFLNQVVELQTYIGSSELLKITQEIEQKLGRTVKKSEWLYEGRPLDIDILFFNDEIIHSDDLMVPHPHIRYRKFVLDPLCDHWADFEHPEFMVSMERLRHVCDDPCVVRLYDEKACAVEK
jgi:2-amino-4-hydroxy-6-hydroxymethyldihydropteridine diphosphokinase